MLTSTDLIKEIRKDPLSYTREFSSRVHNFNATLQLLAHTPKNVTPQDLETIHFLTATCQFYQKETKIQCLPHLFTFLETSDLSQIPVPPLRAIIQLFHHSRQRKLITDDRRYLQLLINLTKLRNKAVRKDIYHKILSECSSRSESKVHKSIIFKHTRDGHRQVSRLCFALLIAMYRRQVWNKDSRVVNILADACTSNDTFTMCVGLSFFLNDQPLEFSETVDDVIAQTLHLPRTAQKDEDVSPRIQQRNVLEEMKSAIIKHAGSHSKKTKKRKRKFDDKIKRLRRENKKIARSTTQSFAQNTSNADDPASKMAAIRFHEIFRHIKDPLKFASGLYNRITIASSERFEVQLMMMRVLARTISVHKISNERLYSFYPYLIRYLEPSTTHITKILAILAESIHSELNPERIRPLILVLINRFLHHKAEPYVNAIGLNTIRLICERNPLVMNAQVFTTIAEFGKHKVKLVGVAARGIANLFRKGELGELLPKKIKRREDEIPNEDDEEEMMDNEEEGGEEEEDNEETVVDEMDVVLGKAEEEEEDKEEDTEEEEEEGGYIEYDDDGNVIRELREDEVTEEMKVVGEGDLDGLGSDPTIGDKEIAPKYHVKSIPENQKRKKKNFMMVRLGRSRKQKVKMSSGQRKKRKRESGGKNSSWKKKKKRKFF